RVAAAAGSNATRRSSSLSGHRRPPPNCAEAAPTHRLVASKQIRIFFRTVFFPSFSLQIGRHGVIRVVGQREVARQIDFDPVPLADGDGRKNVEKTVEDLRRGLRGALRKSLAHEISAGRGQSTGGSAFGHSSTGPS